MKRLPDGWWMRQSVVAERGAIVTTVRMRTMMAITCVDEGTDPAALEARAAERNRTETEGDGADHAYQRARSGEMTDAQMEAWHNETIARVKSGAIVIPRANRPSVYDLAELIQARTREMLREMSPEELTSYRRDNEGELDEEEEQDEELGVWEWQPLADEMIDRIADEFDVQDPDEPGRQTPEELLELIYDAVGTWLNEQEAAAEGLPPPVMTAREQGTFYRELLLDELRKRPPGTVAGDVMPIVDEKMAQLEALRRKARDADE